MNQLHCDQLRLPVCGMPHENPFPPLHLIWRTSTKEALDPALPPEEYADFGCGIPGHYLPYSELVGYTRERTPGALPTLVLENNRLRATFMPTLGGRLWSLWDKRDGRELLYANSVLQFGKLAIRNAWFSGGIEWNIGFPGHSPFTASDVFASELHDEEGRPVLRFHEWERLTGATFQIDCFFPDDDSEFLFTCVRIANPDPTWSTTYWWSNTAYPETESTRVIVPTRRAITHCGDIEVVDPADHNGCDGTYPSRVGRSLDYFYYMPRGTRPWEAAVQADGKGLLCSSTNVMRGRKLFLWGNGRGGRHWSDFLSGPNGPYVEIQSGLAKTQMECAPLPPQSEICWVESFGPIALDPAEAHSPDFDRAIQAAAQNIEARLPEAAIEAVAVRARTIAKRPPEKFLHHGSGWAALELRRRAADGETPLEFASAAYPDAALGALQEPWLQLLAGELPEAAAIALPSWQTSDAWLRLLRRRELELSGAERSPWLQYQLALNDFKRGAYARCLLRLNYPEFPREVASYVERLRAGAHTGRGEHDAALAAWRKVLALRPGEERLLAEAMWPFLNAGLAAEFIDHLPGGVPAGRLRQMRVRTLLRLERIDEAEALMATPFEVPDTQEGESSLSELWLELRTRRLAHRSQVPWTEEFHRLEQKQFLGDIPAWTDFRMVAPPVN